jgi:DNA-binding NarL/FixJ family response regulator
VATGPREWRPRVVLAEDQAAVLTLLEQLLRHDFDVVATVRDGRALVDAVSRLTPDAIVTDISMPFLDGFGAAREILCKNPSARLIFVTVHAEPLWMKRALAVGALGYVRKITAGEELVPAVWAALRGERWCPCSS